MPLTGYDYLLDLTTSISGQQDLLLNESTPQSKALNWLAYEDTAGIPQEAEFANNLTERYVIALLHFAMGGEDWIEPMDFLSNSSVCEWPPLAENAEDETTFTNGIRCNSDGQVNQIRLGKFS